MILDTTAIIDILRGDPLIIAKIKNLDKENTPVYFTSISVFEIWQGVKDTTDNKKREEISLLLESIANFTFDVSAAKEAGSIHASLRRSGQIIDPEDSMIAGIAKIRKEKILTRNLKHFQRIQNLMVEGY